MWPFSRLRQHGPHGAGSADLGRRGEKLARQFLKKRRCAILAHNYRCPAGEVDLIALEKAPRGDDSPGTLLFVEVKTRSSDYYTDPEAAVDADKQRRLRNIAEYYLSKHSADDYDVRFDIVAIVFPVDGKPMVNHIPNAF